MDLDQIKELVGWPVKSPWVVITTTVIVITLATFCREFIKTVAADVARPAVDWCRGRLKGKGKKLPHRARVASNRVTGRPGIDFSTWRPEKWEANWKLADVAYLCADSEPAQLPHDDPIVKAWRERLTTWAQFDVLPTDAAAEMLLEEWLSIVEGLCDKYGQPPPSVLTWWRGCRGLTAI